MSWNVKKETRNSIWMMREGKEWGEIVEIYRKNKRNKSTDIIEEGQIY